MPAIQLDHLSTHSSKIICILAIGYACLSAIACGEDSDIVKQLQEKGVAVAEAKGVGTTVTVKECSKLTEADFRAIGKLNHVKSISLGLGLNDASLALLADLTDVETFSTNGMQLTDEGLKPLSHLKMLKSVAIFHPGPLFSGEGLVHLTECPNLERLTVAGSEKFGDAGMAAVGKLIQLKEFRTWHAGVTSVGVQNLKSLTKLKSINLGQRLSYKPPVSVSDETLPILAEISSLESIQLSEARLSLAALRQLKQLPVLKKLQLDGIQLPKTDLEVLKTELPKVDVKYTEPSEAYTKRIGQLFGGQ